MAQDTTKWEDTTLPPPPPDWMPVVMATEHTQRLMALIAELDARAAVMSHRAEGRDTIRKWWSSAWYCLQSWARLSGLDPEQGVELEHPSGLDLYTMAANHRLVVIDEGTKAVTWALRLGHRRDANRMSFYLDREVSDLERIFGIK